jgi:hypothetical protein
VSQIWKVQRVEPDKAPTDIINDILFFFWYTRVWTQGLIFARKALLPLEPLYQPFVVMGFLRQSLANYLLGAIFPPQSS